LVKKNASERGIYVIKILAILKPQMRVLDVGCGTAHILQALARGQSRFLFIGLDVSVPMLDLARENTAVFPNIGLVRGDGHRLSFAACSLDVVVTRLANYSPQEAYRVLRTQGIFVEYGLGPKADKEIEEFFPKRLEKENCYFPKSLKTWKQEACEAALDSGFTVSSIEDYIEDNYYENDDELMNLIEMVPLVKDFDREKDRKTIRGLRQKYSDKGVRITWRYYILIASKR
jgi:SAM-dependent methyltransferase